MVFDSGCNIKFIILNEQYFAYFLDQGGIG